MLFRVAAMAAFNVSMLSKFEILKFGIGEKIPLVTLPSRIPIGTYNQKTRRGWEGWGQGRKAHQVRFHNIYHEYHFEICFRFTKDGSCWGGGKQMELINNQPVSNLSLLLQEGVNEHEEK